MFDKINFRYFCPHRLSMMKHTFLILVLLLTFNNTLSAQSQYRCRLTTYTETDGLSQGRVTSIDQDADGVLWIATWDGLNRYDGYEFTCYKAMPGNHEPLMQNRFDKIQINSENDIWCLGKSRFYLFHSKDRHFEDIHTKLETKFNRTITSYNVVSLANGYSWLQDKDGTLYRVDNNNTDNIELYPNPESHRRKIYEIKLDSQGNEWVLTSQGIIYKGAPFKNNLSYKCWLEHDSVIWLGTSNVRIAMYDMKTRAMAFVENMPLLPSPRRLYSMHAVDDSTVMLATSGGLLFINTHTLAVEQVKLPTRTGSQDVLSCKKDSDANYLLLAPDYRAYMLNIATRRIMELKQPASTEWNEQDATRPLFFTNALGEAFLFLRTGGLHIVDRAMSRLVPYNAGRFLPSDMRLVFQDRQKNVWLGGNVGLHKLSFGNEGLYQHSDYLQDIVRGTYTDSHGRMWISSQYGIIEIWEGDMRLGYLAPDGRIVPQKTEFGVGVYSMLEDASYNVWLGSRGEGLYRLRYESPTRYRVTGQFKNDEHAPYSISGNHVYALWQDKQSRIWVGCYDTGLNLIQNPDADTPRFLHENNRLALLSDDDPKTVRCISETDDGVMLVGTTQGLYTFDENFTSPENIQFYRNVRQKDDVESLGGNDVMGIEVAENGDIYLAVFGGGLNKVMSKNLLTDKIRFKSYAKQSGAYSDIAINLVEDRNGYIWVLTERLLMRFDPKSENFENFGTDIFPRYATLAESKPYICDDGNLLVATSMGILVVEPDKISNGDYVPTIVFGDGMDSVVLQSDENILSVSFAAVDLSSDAPIRYAYKLDGVDKNWKITYENLTANYVNLPSGSYNLRVKSTNRNGLWVDNERVLPVTRKPSFSETPWAILLYVVVAIVLIGVIVFIYLHIYKLRYRLRLEHQLTESKIRFFTDISHELRTPLTLIEGPLSEVLADEALPESDREYLTVVQTNAHRMLNLVNQILDFRKIQNDKMCLLVEKLNVREQLDGIMENFENVSRMHNIDFRLEMGAQDVYVWADRDKFEKIFVNLISNAFKYTQPGKSIRVAVSMRGERVSIAVCDEGIGIQPEKINTLFRRFDTILQNNIYRQSTGIGLSLVKQLVELHHADISVQSKEGEGSTFEVLFKAGKSHFEEDNHAEFLLNDSDADDEKVVVQQETEDVDGDDGRFSVLVVEDNRDLRVFLQNSLCRSYKVYVAANGEEGWAQTLEYMPDIVITDLMMPELDGFGLIERIKADSTTCHIPIVVLTAKNTLDDRIRGANSGIADYMVKPFSTQLLKARVAMILQQQQLLQERYMAHLGDSGDDGAEYHPSELSIMPADENFMQKLMTYVETNIDNPDLCVDDLAQEMALSRSVFFRKVKALVGHSPINFLQEIRIKRAIQLMETRNFSIAEVAYKVGYADPKYFSRSFKKITGKSPSEYIKEE